MPGLCRTSPYEARRPGLVGGGLKSEYLRGDLTSGQNPCLEYVTLPCPHTTWAMIHNRTGMEKIV